MTLNEIYNNYQIGSQSFITAIYDYCGFGISRNEIARIAATALTAEAFQERWENTDGWLDENNEQISPVERVAKAIYEAKGWCRSTGRTWANAVEGDKHTCTVLAVAAINATE